MVVAMLLAICIIFLTTNVQLGASLDQFWVLQDQCTVRGTPIVAPFHSPLGVLAHTAHSINIHSLICIAFEIYSVRASYAHSTRTQYINTYGRDHER